MLALALSLVVAAPPLGAMAKDVLTSFRGIYLGMTPEEVSRALPSEFYLHIDNITIIRRENNKIWEDVYPSQINLFSVLLWGRRLLFRVFRSDHCR